MENKAFSKYLLTENAAETQFFLKFFLNTACTKDNLLSNKNVDIKFSLTDYLLSLVRLC